MIRFKCPKCQEEMEADNSAGGQKTKCVKCQADIDVPFPEYLESMSCTHCAKPLPEMTYEMAGKIVQCPHCHTGNVIPDREGMRQGCFKLFSLMAILAAVGVGLMIRALVS